MSVRRTGNGRWMADVSTGTGERVRRVFRTKREAQDEEKRLLSEATGRSSMTVAEFTERVFWRVKSGLRGDTKRCYESDLRVHILPAIGSKGICDVTKLDVQRLLDSTKSHHVAKNVRGTLSSVLSTAYEMGMVDVNVAKFRYTYPPRPKRTETANGDWLQSFDEHAKLVEFMHSTAPGTLAERMLVLGLSMGLRPGESRGLDWERVDLDSGEVRIVQTYVLGYGRTAEVHPPKTHRSVRTVPIPRWAVEIMKGWSRTGLGTDLDGNPCHPVTVGHTGSRATPSASSDALRRWLKAHPVYGDGSPVPHVTLESLRHSFATAAVNAGVEVSVVSRILGHCDVATTYNRYVKPKLDSLRAAQDLSDEAFRKCLSASR